MTVINTLAFYIRVSHLSKEIMAYQISPGDMHYTVPCAFVCIFIYTLPQKCPHCFSCLWYVL